MALYDGRLAHIHDTDIFYVDGTSLATTTSWYSDTIDLGSAQVFVNVPAHIFWKISANFSLLSRITSINSVTRWEGIREFMEVQDSADGSTGWSGIILIPMFDPASAVSVTTIVDVTTFNAKNVGLGSIRRYSRLAMQTPTASDPVTIKAWLRMGVAGTRQRR